MKRIFLVYLMMTAATFAIAQSAGMYSNKWESNNNGHRKEIQAEFNPFEQTTMAVNDGYIVLSDLPELKKRIWAVITNGEGEFIKQKRITASENEMDISRLHRGLYYVTLIYQEKGKRAFVLNL